MRVVLRVGDREVDVEVAVHDPAATVADLATVVFDRARTGLVIDGVAVPGSTALTLSGLRPGCEVAPLSDGGAVAVPVPDHQTELLVVGGMAAGARHGLARGLSIVGRDPDCAVVLASRTTSSSHAEVLVEAPEMVSLADSGSTSGTWINGRRVDAAEPLAADAIAALGASLVRVAVTGWREPAILGPSGADGRRPLHRPPLPAWPLPSPQVAPPTADPPAIAAPRFGWAAALVPLVGGLVLARLIDPRLALFTLLGPAVLVGQWLEDRRRHRRQGAETGTARRAGLAAFAADVSTAGASEARRRQAVHPDPAALGVEVEALGSGLWSRRPGHPAFGEVAVGMAPALAWVPPTSRPAEGPATAVLAAARLPYGCPVTVDLSSGSHLGIAGSRSAALAVARWVLLQLAAHHGPADIRIGVVCAAGREGEWTWVPFVPHSAAPRSEGRRLLAVGHEQASQVAEVRAPAGAGAHLVVVVDGDDLFVGGGGALIGGANSSLTIAPSRRALPARCTSVLELDGPDGWGQVATGAEAPQTILATGIDEPTARRWARHLAGLADPEAEDGAASPPGASRLLDLLELDEPTSETVRRRWSGRRGAATPLGCSGGPEGAEPVHLDLIADGPHVLVAGTTGAGKSELLRTLVAGLAASSSPDRLVLLLVDYKGGSAFAEAAQLPHVLGVVTDLGPDEAARALESLEAELRRREGVLAELGLRDVAAHPAHGLAPSPPGIEPLPRLVVVVDELAALVAELPAFLDGLVQLAARGRSLGLHLVLATQRPGSVVSASVRTNCTVRCCLRVPDEADALDVVGSPAPAHLDRRQPGRAFLRRGASDLVELQVALVGGRRAAGRAPVTVEPATFGPDALAAPVEEQAADVTDLAALVDACRAAAIEVGLTPPRPLWLAPLPPVLPASELPRQDGDVVLGLLDDPAHQRRLPMAWCPGEGPLVAVGTGPGPAAALQAVARVLAARLSPGQLHVYGLDLAAQGLSSLAELPHLGAVIRPGEHERLHRLIRRLATELTVRQSAAALDDDTTDPPPPLILVLINGVAALRGALDGGGGLAALDALERVVVDGSGLGLVVAVAADRLAVVPGAWTTAAARRLAFRGGDPLDQIALGPRRVDQTRWPHGRCLDLASALVGQIATCGWTDPVGRSPDDRRPGPAPVIPLPQRIPLATVLDGHSPRADADGLHLPLGVEGLGLDIAVARLRPGQPFLICGPPGAGRTTALAVVAEGATQAGCDVVTADSELAERVASRTAAGADGPPLVVLVDDAERVADPDGILAGLAAGDHAAAHLVATAPPDAVRAAFGHWSAGLRRAPAGLVLRPRSELDADVLGIPFLPRWPVPLSGLGRGVLVVDGEALPVQVATP